MKFSLKNFRSPSTLILFALLATFLFYLYFRQSSHDMDLDFYDYDSDDSDDLEDDDMEGFIEGAKFVGKRWDPVRANKQAAKRRRRRRRRR